MDEAAPTPTDRFADGGDELFQQFVGLGEDGEFAFISGLSLSVAVDRRGDVLNLRPTCSIRDVVSKLRSGFSGLADTPSALCPFHAAIGGCQRTSIASEPPSRLDTPWWKRRPDAHALASLQLCSMFRALSSSGCIFVWKGITAVTEADVRTLLGAVRQRGPHVLLWVAPATADRPAGLVENLGQGLLKGYLMRLASEDGGKLDVDHRGWTTLCRNAASLAHFLREAGEIPPHGPGIAFDDILKSAPSLPEVELRYAATRLHLEEARSTGISAGAVQVGGAFRDHDRRWFPENPGSEEIHGAELSNVTIQPRFPVLLQNGRVIKEVLRSNTLEWERDQVLVSTQEIRAIASEKLVLIGFNRSFRTYYHWLLQSLPALDVPLSHVDPNDCALALPRMNRWQNDSLRLLGLDQLSWIEVDPACDYYFPRVYFSEYLTGRTSFKLSPRSMQVYEQDGCAG